MGPMVRNQIKTFPVLTLPEGMQSSILLVLVSPRMLR